MSIKVRWHNDDREFLIVQFTSRWTWSAFFRAKATLDNLLDDVHESVDCVFLLPSDMVLPPDSIRNGRHAFHTMHPNLKQIIIVKPNMLIHTIYKMAVKKQPSIRHMVTLSETYEPMVHPLEKLSTF